MKTVYFILGMHRSGTSAVGGVLNKLGIYFGNYLMEPNENNPKGYFENNHVYLLNKKIFNENNSSWSDYNFDIQKIKQTDRDSYVEQIKKIINEEYKYADKFAIKDPRICLNFPLWEKACLELDITIKIILPYRNPLEVVESLRKREKFSHEYGMILWIKHFLSAEKYSRNYPRIFLDFDQLIVKPKDSLKFLSKFTGFEINADIESKVNEFLDKDNKHFNLPLANFTENVPGFLKKIINIIKDKDFENSNMFDDCNNDFYNSLNMFQHTEISNLIGQHETLESDKAILIDKLNVSYDMQSSHAKLLKQAEVDSSQKAHVLNETIGNLHSELLDNKNKMSDQNQEFVKVKKTAEELQQKINESIANNKKTVSDLEQLKNEYTNTLSKKEEQLESEKTKRVELTSKYHVLESKNSMQEKLLKEVKIDVAKLNEELVIKTEIIGSLTQENTSFKDQVISLKNSFDNAIESDKSLKIKVLELENKLELKSTHIEELKVQNRENNAELNKHLVNNKVFKSRLDQAENLSGEQYKTISKQKSHLSKQNTVIQSSENEVSQLKYALYIQEKNNQKIKYNFMSFHEFLHTHIDSRLSEIEQSLVQYEGDSIKKLFVSKSKLIHFLNNQKLAFNNLNQIKVNYNRLPLRFMEHFDQEQYLDQNDDVRSAIHDGMFKNAVEHFINFGYDEISSGSRHLYSNSEVIKEIDYLLTNNQVSQSTQNSGQTSSNIKPLDAEIEAISKTNASDSDQFPLYNVSGDVAHNSTRKNVLICAHVVGKYLFGSERSFLDMVKAASQNNHNVYVSLPQKQAEYIKFLKPMVTKIIVFKYNWWRKELPINKAVIKNFESIIRHYHINLVHVNTLMLREPLLAAKNQYVKSIVHVRELLNGDQTLVDVIGQSPKEVSEFIYNSSDIVLANSKATSELFPKSSKVKIIHNTVAVEDFDFDNTIESKIKIGLISSNIPKKGIFDFVEVAKKCISLTNVSFLLIGPNNEHTAKLKDQQKQGTVPENIVFTGYKKTASEAIESINIVLSLSNFTESFGRTVIEGMSAGRPVIAYKWGAVAELIDDGIDGYLTEYKDTNAIAEKIKLLVSSHEKILEMGINGKVKAQFFSFQNYQEKLKNLYQNVLYNQKQTDLSVTKNIIEHKIKIGYFLWHFPVPSETFVLNELRQLKLLGFDVMVYCKQSPYKDFKPDFDIQWQRVSSVDELALLIKKDQRDVIHSHFTYPTVTDMVWPACEKAKINFTFIAHAQDIFRYSNEQKNRIDEIAASQYCYRVFVPSRFHLNYLTERNVPSTKIVINPNGINPKLYQNEGTIHVAKRGEKKICAIHRFTEKKGLENLILAAGNIYDKIQIHIYGYGELEQRYKDLAEDFENVYIHGGVENRQAMLDIFAQHDFFACPSVRAEDGDMDGIPTVVMEAMASGIPVLTTAISGIPDLVVDEITGIITESTPTSIAKNINRFYDLPTSKVSAIVENAQNTISVNYNTQNLVQNLLRVWSKKTIDLIIVSWNNLPELKEVIRRLLKYTSMPSRLIVCDNNSKSDVKKYLSQIESEHDQVTIIFNSENSFVGPGTNIALEESQSDFAIYVCGKEGFVFNHGWEQPIIKYMNENITVGLAGTLGYSPTYLKGKHYPDGVSEFPKFRNKEFAINNPERLFKHVQGGFFVIRKSMYNEIGGFSNAVPHNYTDVEYSYYVESCGWKLGSIPQMLALYNKTRPGIFSRIDESMNAIHPPTLVELEKLDRIFHTDIRFCNVCELEADNFIHKNDLSYCPKCKSTEIDRSLIRYFAESTLTHRRLLGIAINLSKPVLPFWKKQFQGRCLSESSLLNELKSIGKIDHPNNRLNLAYIGIENLMNEKQWRAVLKELKRILCDNAQLIIQFKNNQDNHVKFINQLSESGFHLNQAVRYCSNVVQYDWNKLHVFQIKE